MNMTYNGLSGSCYAVFDPGLDDNTIRRLTEEAVRSGQVSGIPTNIPANAFADSVIDRIQEHRLVRLVIRPKVPFG
jgi:hypothetical protein